MKSPALYLAACAVGSLLGAPAYADSCHAVRTTGAAYAPTYTPSYGHEVYPYAIPVAIIPSQFYSVSPELAVGAIIQAASDAAALKAKASGTDIEAAVERALLRFLQNQKPPAVNPPGPGPAPLGPPIPPAVEATAPAAGSALVAVQRVVQAKCVACHRAGDQYPDLTDLPRARAEYRATKNQDLYSVMVLRVMTDGKGRMPPKGPSVAESGDELSAFHGLALEGLKTK